MEYCLLVFWNFKNQDLVKVFGSCTGIDEFTVEAGDVVCCMLYVVCYSVASYKLILVTCCFQTIQIINIELTS